MCQYLDLNPSCVFDLVISHSHMGKHQMCVKTDLFSAVDDEFKI